jgi:hypothetical protein
MNQRPEGTEPAWRWAPGVRCRPRQRVSRWRSAAASLAARGATLAVPATGYAAVYALEIALLLATTADGFVDSSPATPVS